MGEITDRLLNEFQQIFGNSGTNAFALEWAFAKYIDRCLADKEATWIDQAHAILKEKGFVSEDNAFNYNNHDNTAYIYDIGLAGCKSIVVISKNRNYIYTVQYNEQGLINYHKLKEMADKENDNFVAGYLKHLESYLIPKVHIRRFYDKKESDEKKGNRYPERPTIKNMKHGKPPYRYMDLRDTGYLVSTGELTPNILAYGELKSACSELNSLLATLDNEYDIQSNYNFKQGTRSWD